VDVLEHDDPRPGLAELLQQRRGDGVRRRAVGHEPLQLPTGARADVDQRAERREREQRIAVAPQDPRRLALARTEVPHQHGLAHARLTCDQHEPPTGRQRAVERLELRTAFEQHRLRIGKGDGHASPILF
jgi:hypothetical protein